MEEWRTVSKSHPVAKTEKPFYFHMSYEGKVGRSFATKQAAVRLAARYMREKDFVVVVRRHAGQDVIVWRSLP